MSYGQGNSERKNPLKYVTVPIRRQVYPGSEIAHKWAHQTQPAARNAQGNLYFKGPTIYSYRDSWPLGHIHTISKGDKARTIVLTNSDTYSSTTAGHQASVNSACSHMERIACPRVSGEHYPGASSYADRNGGKWHAQNLAHFAEVQTAALAKAKRAMQSGTVNYLRSMASTACANDRAYRAFFKLRGKPLEFQYDAFIAAETRAKSIENPDPIRDAKRFKAREQRAAALEKRHERLEAEYATLQAQFAAEHAAVLDQWRNGGALPRGYISYPATWTRADKRALGCSSYGLQSGRVPCMLRVVGDQIETSQGASIPLAHAPRIWRLVSACVSAGREYKRNGHTEHAGEYAIDSVSAAGELRAGCHTIPYAELQRLAAALGYTEGGA